MMSSGGTEVNTKNGFFRGHDIDANPCIFSGVVWPTAEIHAAQNSKLSVRVTTRYLYSTQVMHC